MKKLSFKYSGLILLLICVNSLYAQVVINEIFYNPAGTDTGLEWIEIFNNNAESVDMDGWELDCDIAPYYTFQSYVLAAYSYVVVHLRQDGPDTQTDLFTGSGWSSSNLGNSSGQVTLYKSDSHTQDNLIDYVEYGSTGKVHESPAINIGQWPDPPDFAPLVSEGYSIEYDGSGNSGADWISQSNPTPGVYNILPVFLSFFSAKSTQNGILLSWRSETEIGNMGFNLYKWQKNLNDRSNISGFIRGAGTSNQPNNYEYLDLDVIEEKTYYYQIEDVGINGITNKSNIISIQYSIAEHRDQLPLSMTVSSSYPNPFGNKSGNPGTSVIVNIPASHFSIAVYNLVGQKVYHFFVNENAPGKYVFQWYGKNNGGNNLANGIYLWIIKSETTFKARRIILLN